MSKIQELFDRMQEAEKRWRKNRPAKFTPGKVEYQSDIPWPNADSPKQNLHHNVCEGFIDEMIALDNIALLALVGKIRADFHTQEEQNLAVPIFCVFASIKKRLPLAEVEISGKFLYDNMGRLKFCDKLCWEWHERMQPQQKLDFINSLIGCCSHYLQIQATVHQAIRIHWPIYQSTFAKFVPGIMTAEEFDAAANIWATHRRDNKLATNLNEVSQALAKGRTVDGAAISPATKKYLDAYNGKAAHLKTLAQIQAENAAKSPWAKGPKTDMQTWAASFRGPRRPGGRDGRK